jgi:hypothetical protein
MSDVKFFVILLLLLLDLFWTGVLLFRSDRWRGEKE